MSDNNEQKANSVEVEFSLAKIIDDICEDWGLKCTYWEGDTHYEATKEAKEELSNKIQQCISGLQSENAALKLEVEKYREALGNIMDSHVPGQTHTERLDYCILQAEQVLKENNQNSWIEFNIGDAENLPIHIVDWKHPEYGTIRGNLVKYEDRPITSYWIFPDDGGRSADIWLGEFTHYKK